MTTWDKVQPSGHTDANPIASAVNPRPADSPIPDLPVAAPPVKQKVKFRSPIVSSRSVCRFVLILCGSVMLLTLLYGVYRYFFWQWSDPVHVHVTNVTSRSATVSWVTREAVPGFVIYSESKSFMPWMFARAGKSVGYDDRDVVAAREAAAEEQRENIAEDGVEIDYSEVAEEPIIEEVGEYYVHHATLRNLDPEVTYYFQVGNGVRFTRPEVSEDAGGSGDNSLVTFDELEEMPVPNPAYGLVKLWGDEEKPVTDGVMYMTLEYGEYFSKPASGVLSSNGSWYIDLNNIRDSEGEVFWSVVPSDRYEVVFEHLEVEAGKYGLYAKRITTEEDAPASPITVMYPEGESDDPALMYEGNTVYPVDEEGGSSSLLVSYIYADDCGSGPRQRCSVCDGDTERPKCEKGTTYAADGGVEGHGYMEYCARANCEDPTDEDCECSCTNGPKFCPNEDTHHCKDHKCVPDQVVPQEEENPPEGGGGSYVGCDTTTNIGPECCDKLRIGGECIDLDTNTCTGGTFDNMCPGGQNVKCCTGGSQPGGANDSQCAREGGHCYDTQTQTCDSEPEYNKCPQGSNVICCKGSVSDIGMCDGVTTFENTSQGMQECGDYCLRYGDLYSCRLIDGCWGCYHKYRTPKECGKLCDDQEKCSCNFDGGGCVDTDGGSVEVVEYVNAGEYCPSDSAGSLDQSCKENDRSACHYPCDWYITCQVCRLSGTSNEEACEGVSRCGDDLSRFCGPRENCINPDEYGRMDCNDTGGTTYVCCDEERPAGAVADNYPSPRGSGGVSEKDGVRADIGCGVICSDMDSCLCNGQDGCQDPGGGDTYYQVGFGGNCPTRNIYALGYIFPGDQCEDEHGCYCPKMGISNIRKTGWCPYVKKCTTGADGQVCDTKGNLCSGGRCGAAGDTGGSASIPGFSSESVRSGIFHLGRVFAQESGTIVLSPIEGMFAFEDDGLYCTKYGTEEYCFEVPSPGEIVLYIDTNDNWKFDEGDIDLADDGVQLELNKVAVTTRWIISEGFNVISFPVVSDSSTMMASQVLAEWNDYYNDAFYSIAKLEDGRWVVVGDRDGATYASEDFQIVPGVGYLIRSKADMYVEWSGKEVVTPVPVNLSEGWNLMAIHGTDESYTASSLLDSIDLVSGLDGDNVTEWDPEKAHFEGLQKEADAEGVMQVYGFDFSLEKESGYFVRIASGKGTWTPD